VVTCAPALNLQRDDLLFFPGTFVGLSYASAAVALTRRGGAARWLFAGVVVFLIAGATWIGLVFAENFHPDSARSLWWNTQLVHGELATRATIPAARRRAIAARLDALGIRAGEQPRRRVRELAAQARAAGRRRPSTRGEVFAPLLPEGF
jgi:hypothetical protein